MNNEILEYIDSLKYKIEKDMRLDKEIKVSNYTNIARLKVCEKIEQYIKKGE